MSFAQRAVAVFLFVQYVRGLPEPPTPLSGSGSSSGSASVPASRPECVSTKVCPDASCNGGTLTPEGWYDSPYACKGTLQITRTVRLHANWRNRDGRTPCSCAGVIGRELCRHLEDVYEPCEGPDAHTCAPTHSTHSSKSGMHPFPTLPIISVRHLQARARTHARTSVSARGKARSCKDDEKDDNDCLVTLPDWGGHHCTPRMRRGHIVRPGVKKYCGSSKYPELSKCCPVTCGTCSGKSAKASANGKAHPPIAQGWAASCTRAGRADSADE